VFKLFLGKVSLFVAALDRCYGQVVHALANGAARAGLAPADAETFVVDGITAWQMLHRGARVRAGGTTLVHGGVGTTLVQLARVAGIRVIGTASARNADVVTALGGQAEPPPVPRAAGGGPDGRVRTGRDRRGAGPGGGPVPADRSHEGPGARGVRHDHRQGRPRTVE
jgi:hypothetical protein